MELHILSGGSSRSRSSFKVIGKNKINLKRRSHKAAHFEWRKFKVKVILQSERSKKKFFLILFQSGAIGDIVFMTNTSLVFFLNYQRKESCFIFLVKLSYRPSLVTTGTFVKIWGHSETQQFTLLR